MADQIHESFENDNYTLGGFLLIYPRPAFDTTDNALLLKKLEIYGIKGINQKIQIDIFKSLMIAKAIYKMLHVEYHKAPFLYRYFF